MDFEEDSSITENVQDDSGYHTNTPLSCELQSVMERLPKDSNSHRSTPVGAITKHKQMTLNSPKKLDGILTQKTTQHFSLGPVKKSYSRSHVYNQSPTINEYRNRLNSMPDLMSYGTIKEKSYCQDFPSKHLFKRLLSIDFTENSIYQGWFNLDSDKSGIHNDKKVDFIAKLSVGGNLLNLALQIFGYLDPQDLLSASKVSIFWKQIIKQDKALASKLRRFKLQREMQLRSDVASKENASVDVAGSIGRRSSCADIKNLVMSKQGSGGPVPNPPPPASFNEIARENGRWLRLCPKCSHPAQVEVCGILAQCLRNNCGHRFCVKCRFKVHGDEKCKAVEYESPRRIIVGSKNSKRNIRRL